jgi:hypothetical protein
MREGKKRKREESREKRGERKRREERAERREEKKRGERRYSRDAVEVHELLIYIKG